MILTVYPCSNIARLYLYISHNRGKYKKSKTHFDPSQNIFKSSASVFNLHFSVIYTIYIINQLTRWSRLLLDKLVVSQLFKKFSAFRGV
jgi:hypothetical protein